MILKCYTRRFSRAMNFAKDFREIAIHSPLILGKTSQFTTLNFVLMFSRLEIWQWAIVMVWKHLKMHYKNDSSWIRVGIQRGWMFECHVVLGCRYSRVRVLFDMTLNP